MSRKARREIGRRKPTLEALRALVTLDESAGVSDAARRLEVSQPVVSRKLSVFKDPAACGAVLLRDSAEGPRLTESGQAVLPAIRELVARYDRIMEYLRGENDTPQVLRIATGSFAAEHYLPQAVSALRHSLEECQTETRICRGRERVLGVARGAFDMAIVTYSPAQVEQALNDAKLPADTLKIIPLAQHPMCVVAARESEAYGELRATDASRAISVRALKQWELIGPDRQSGLRRQLESHFGPNQLYFVAEGGGWPAAKRYAQLGLGVAIVPLVTVTAEDRRTMVCRRLAGEFAVTDYLIHRAEELTTVQQRMKQAVLTAAKELRRELS